MPSQQKVSPKEKPELAAADVKHVFHPLTAPRFHMEQGPIVFVKGEGIYLGDSQGRRYIDGLAGLWNVAIGHGQQEVAEAAYDQMKTLEYVPTFFGFSSAPAIRLAQKIADVAPGDLTRVFFTNSGSEATETAFKIARFLNCAAGRENKVKIIARTRGYHGASIGAGTATGLSQYWRFFGPRAPGFVHINPPYCYRCAFGREYPDCNLECAAELETAICREGRDTVAAFIAEPVMGTGGVIVPPREYLSKVREICDKYEVLLIADEVITGWGRLGDLFGVNVYNVVPDMIASAKGLSSAYLPLGATLVRESLFQQLVELLPDETSVFFHGFTTNGHPVCCAAALKNVEIILREKLPQRAREVGAYFQEHVRSLLEFATVGEVRGMGLIAGIEFVKDKRTKEPFPAEVGFGRAVVREAFKDGLICRAVGGGDVIALSPPLTISREEIETVVSILRVAIAKAEASYRR